MDSFELKFPDKVLDSFTEEEFYLFCQQNRDLKFERTFDKRIIIMTPSGGIIGNKGMRIGARLDAWNEQTNLGYTFDSSTGFTLPNEAIRSPDASWVAKARWEALSLAEQERFPPICPDFIIELKSPSDRLSELHKKMEEYQSNGCRLGWLIDSAKRMTYIYRSEGMIETPFNKVLDGEMVLPGFSLNLTKIF